MALLSTTLQLLALRNLFNDTSVTGTERGISAYIVPNADAHYGESIAECDKRLKYMSEFAASFGSAIITNDYALLWTDGRYYLQAEETLDENWELMRDGLPDTPSQADFLNKNLTRGSLVGVDPYLYSKTDWDALESALKLGGHTLVGIERNLVDEIWGQRPPCPKGEIFPLEIQFTGMNSSEKLRLIRADMEVEGADGVVLSELDDIAWLLNLRGFDLESASVFISYAIVKNNSFQLFVDVDKLTTDVHTEIDSNGGEIYAYEDIGIKLDELVAATSGKIWFGKKTSYGLVQRVPAARQLVKLTPIALLKAVKNDVEAEGMRQGLIRDAAAVTRFLHWVELQVTSGENVTELSASARLLEFRRENDFFLTTSFTTIAASGPNGAIIHYRPSEETNRMLNVNEAFLLDSGGIYRDATTDITRTFSFGTPTDFQKDCYTRVMKGQIAVATTTFPSKIPASRIDSYARRALWNVGLDYNHGTGHGIGHALNVHEGPSSMRPHFVPDDQGLRANMFTSNEPGYYHEGADAFGIRLENILRVVNVTLENNFQNRDYLGFEDLVFVPYQHKFIKTELLTRQEIQYLNEYQEKTRTIVGGYIRSKNINDPAYNWLLTQTEPFVFSG